MGWCIMHFFWSRFFSLGLTILRFIHCCMHHWFIPFHSRVEVHCIHSLSVHLTADGSLCERVLSLLLGKYLGGEQLDHIQVHIYLRIVSLSSEVVVPFSSSCRQWMRIPVALHSCQHFELKVFNHRHSNKYAVVVPCSFDFHFPNDFDHLFVCLFAICVFSVVKHRFEFLSTFNTGLFVCFYY